MVGRGRARILRRSAHIGSPLAWDHWLVPRWEHLDVTGAFGPISNDFLRQDGTRLAVVLPGRRGGWLTAAVYYPVLALLDNGFDAVCLDSIYSENPTREQLRDDALAVLRAARAVGDYRHLVLAGKSLGTIAMAELIGGDPDLARARTIWLTPLLRDEQVAAALRQLETPGLIVIGSEDPHHVPGLLTEFQACGHGSLVITGAHHGLAIEGQAIASAAIPAQLVGAVLEYLEPSGV